MKLSSAIKKARAARGISQAELATILGVSPSTVAGWELGTHGLRLDRLKAVARALGVEAEELVA